MDLQDKRFLESKYHQHKDRLTWNERILCTLYILDDWDIGRVAKHTHMEAPIVKRKLQDAVQKLW